MMRTRAIPLRMLRAPVHPALRLNGSVAAVCPTVRSQPVPGQPAARPVAIPPATDLPSAIRAINQIIMYTMIPDWTEVDRVVTPVRIFNPNDKSQWVDVERIASLTFEDAMSGGQWQWNY